jgi:hypothetical protein
VTHWNTCFHHILAHVASSPKYEDLAHLILHCFLS